MDPPLDYPSHTHVRNLLPNFDKEASQKEKSLKPKVTRLTKPDEKGRKKNTSNFLALSDNLIKKLENMKLISKTTTKPKEVRQQQQQQQNKTIEAENKINISEQNHELNQNPFEKENKIPLKRKPLEFSQFNNELQGSQLVDKRREVKVIEAKGPSLEIFSERSLGK